MMSRAYALIDCNNFYASCERVFDPGLKERPIVILSNNDGCIIARSNEAKALEIPMGAPEFKVRPVLKKHNVAVRSSNYALYGDMSFRVMETLRSITPNIEVYSIDEAFAEIYGREDDEIVDAGHEIRRRVYRWTGLPVSVGIAPTKTLAKLANDAAKSDPSRQGVYRVKGQDGIERLLMNSPVEEVWGVGRNYASMLARQGIKTARDLSRMPDRWVQSAMKITGLRTVWELRGTPCLSIEECVDKRKGILTSRSFGKPVYDRADLEEAVATFTGRAAEKLRAQQSAATNLTVTLVSGKYEHPGMPYKFGKSIHLINATAHTPLLIGKALRCVKELYQPGRKYKKAWVMLTGIVPQAEIQADLFSGGRYTAKEHRLMESMDAINAKYGRKSLIPASMGIGQPWQMNQRFLSRRYTTRWDELLEVRI